MAEPMTTFAQLLSRTRERAKSMRPVRAALVGADNASYLKMSARAAKEGIIEPILIGPQKAIMEIAGKENIDIGSCAFFDCTGKVDAVTAAIKLISAGDVDLLMRGNISTGLMLARLFERPTGLRSDDNLISHVAVFEHPLYPKFLLMSDGGVTVAPDIDKRLAIIQNAVTVANLLGVAMPKVAMLAAVEVIYLTMPVTMEAAVIAKMADKGQIKNCRIDGPLSMDVAVVPEVARQKGVTSDVAGQADILIMPNIETGNATYKAMSMFAKAKTAGVIVGGKVPIAISSRCDTEDDIFYSLTSGAWIALNR
jgi:phosphate butyryltransferase